MTLSVLFISCDPNPLAKLHEMDQSIIVTEAIYAFDYSLTAKDIDQEDIDYPLSLTYTLPASFNNFYKENNTFKYPPKYVAGGSEIEINMTSDNSILTITIDIKSKDIPRKKAKVTVVINEDNNDMTYKLEITPLPLW